MEEDVLRKLIKESVPQFVLDSQKGDELFNKVIESFYKVSSQKDTCNIYIRYRGAASRSSIRF